MAKGRPDYNIKVVPVVETIGDDEIPFYKVGSFSLSADQDYYFYTKTPSAGEDLYILYIVISADTTYIIDFLIEIDSTSVLEVRFSQIFEFSAGGNVAFIVEGGQTLKLYAYNGDTSAHNFSYSVRGYTKELD